MTTYVNNVQGDDELSDDEKTELFRTVVADVMVSTVQSVATESVKVRKRV
jgi:hypothetical protein